MFDNLRLHPASPLRIGDSRHGWLKKYKTGATHLQLVINPGEEDESEVDYLDLGHSPTGYAFAFGTLLYYQPQTVVASTDPAWPDEAVLNFGFFLGQPFGYFGSDKTWSDVQGTHRCGYPSGAWLYLDAATGKTWKVVLGRSTVASVPEDPEWPGDKDRTALYFMPFGVFDLDDQPAALLPVSGTVVHVLDDDLGKDFWAEGVTSDGGLAVGYFNDVADYTSRKSVTISGTPGDDLSVSLTNVFTEAYNVWNTVSSTGTTDNPIWSKYRWRGDTVIVAGAAVGCQETHQVNVSGNAQSVTLTQAGHADSVCTLTRTDAFAAGAQTWSYPISLTVTDKYTVTTATETESPPGTWTWSLAVRVDREYAMTFSPCPGADNTWTKTSFTTVSGSGAGRLADATLSYTFSVSTNYILPSSGTLFDFPVADGVTRAAVVAWGWQGYGGPLRGAMERCYDSSGAFQKYRRGKMLATNLVIPAGDWTTGAGVEDDEFTFNPITGEVMEEVGPLDYYWVAWV